LDKDLGKNLEKDLSMYAYLKNSIQDLSQEKIIFNNNRISAEKMFCDIDRVSTFLYDMGIRKGDVVAVCLPNIPQAIIAIYAINKLSAVANLIHPKLSGMALKNALQKTNTKAVFMFSYLVNKNKKDILSSGITIISCNYSDYVKGIKKVYKLGEPINFNKNIYSYNQTLVKAKAFPTESSGECDAILLHSSGTLGDSKIVKLSSNAFNYLAKNIYDMVTITYNHEVNSSDGMLLMLPLFHGFGLGVCVHFACIYNKVVMIPFFKSKTVAKTIAKEKISFTAAVPSMLNKLLKDNRFDNDGLKNFKLIFSGGDKLSKKTKEQFDSILAKHDSSAKVYEGYGLSECTSVVSINLADREDSLGKVLPNVEIAIINNGSKCEVGVEGEICVNSLSVMNGYWDESYPQTTIIDGKKFIHTGDIGYVDNDGFLYFKDRAKRIIIIGGINIYPQEVERIISEIDGIKDCFVARVFTGKLHTKAYLLLEKDIVFSKKLRDKIEKTVKDKIIKYAVPLDFEVVNKFQMTSMGKINIKKYEN
jgi:long-chain acyl-CoA synthetase